MGRLVGDARSLSAALPAEQLDARALTALKGLVAAAIALPEHAGFLTRALRFLPQEIARQILPDGTHAERSPAAQLAALQDLTEIRALLQVAQTPPPLALTGAIERVAQALRMMRHGDGGLALINGAKEESSALIDIALTQAGRGSRGPNALTDGGFHRLQAGRSMVIVDCGVPPAPGLDRFSHAGTLSMELSIGRERMIVNCGGFPAGASQWRDAARVTAAHSTLVIADVNSSELKLDGLGRRPVTVEAQRQEANGATGSRPATTAGRNCSAPCIAAGFIWPKAGTTSAARTRSRRPHRSPSPSASICTPRSMRACSRMARRCCCGFAPAAAGACAPTAPG